MARRKRSYKIPPFRQLNPNYGTGPTTPGSQGGGGLNNYNTMQPGVESEFTRRRDGSYQQNTSFAQTGFESTMIRNETNMGDNNSVQTIGNPTNPDGSAFDKQKAMFPDQTQNNFGLIDPVQAQAAAPQMPIANPEVDYNVIDSSMEIATGKDMSQPIVDENPQNKLEQLYKLS